MTLNTYIKLLQNIASKHGDLPLCYSSDDEGNFFRELNIGPEAGSYLDNEFMTIDVDTEEELPITHVCIN